MPRYPCCKTEGNNNKSQEDIIRKARLGIKVKVKVGLRLYCSDNLSNREDWSVSDLRYYFLVSKASIP